MPIRQQAQAIRIDVEQCTIPGDAQYRVGVLGLQFQMFIEKE
jgi:hypothetical protein